MSIFVVVEGEFDQRFIEILVADLLNNNSIDWVIANGKNAARPLARRYILNSTAPVLLVLDADTTDDKIAAIQQKDLDAYLGWSGGTYASAAILFTPEIEEVFFNSPIFVERSFGNSAGDILKRLAAVSPKEALTLRLNTSPPDKFKAKLTLRVNSGMSSHIYLTNLEIKEMKRHPKIAMIRKFIKNSKSAQNTSSQD